MTQGTTGPRAQRASRNRGEGLGTARGGIGGDDDDLHGGASATAGLLALGGAGVGGSGASRRQRELRGLGRRKGMGPPATAVGYNKNK